MYRESDYEEASPLLSQSIPFVPAIYSQQNGFVGQVATISFRGLSPYNTLVLVDGVPVTSPSNGVFDFGHLLSGSFDRMRFLASASPVQYGPGSNGGVVDLETGQGQAQVKAEGGSFDSLYGYARYATRPSQHRATLHAEGVYTQGLPQYGPTRMLGEKAPYNNQTIAGRYDYADPTTRVKGVIRAMQDYSRYDNSLAPLAPKPQARQTTENVLGSLSLIHDSSASTNHTVEGFVHSNKANFSAENFQHTQGIGGDYTVNHRWSDQQNTLLKVVAEQNYLQKEQGFSKSQSHGGAGILHTFFFIPKVFISGGGRIDHYEKVDPLFLYELNIGYIQQEGMVKGSLRGGGRAPTLYDLYMNNAFVKGNSSLKAEKTKTVDVTWERQIGSAIHLQVSPYWTQAYDLMTNGNSGTQRTTFNVGGTTHIMGVDTLIQLNLTENWKIAPAYTYTTVRYKNTITGSSIPHHKGSLETIYQPQEKWQLTAAVLMVSGHTSQFHTMKPFQVVNVGAAYFLTPAHKVYLKIDNAFDTHYQQVYNYRSPGRALYVGCHLYF